MCAKAKISRILKGNLNVGYININTNSPQKAAVWIPEEGTDNGGMVWRGRCIIKIHKTDAKGGYTTENTGVYATVGKIYHLEDVGFDMHNKIIDGKKTLYNSTEEFYKKLQNCCGVDINAEKKSPLTNKSYSNRLTNSIKVTNAIGCSELYISEYICGQGNNKSIEIYNPTNAAINLSNYSLLIYHGASTTPTTIVLTGTIAAYSTLVVSNTNASSAILALTNQTSHNLMFNGDECIVLNKAAIHIDKIGEIGVAIGSGGWAIPPSGSTNNSDLRRMYNITAGDTNWTNCKNEWDIFPNDSIHNLGQHKNLCADLPDPIIYFSFAHEQLSGGYLTFDIMVSTDSSPVYLVTAPIHFTYDTVVFGRNIVANGNITVTNGPAFNNTNYQPANTNNTLSDKAQNEFRAAIFADLTLSSNTLASLPYGGGIVLMSMKVKVKNCYYPQTIRFFSFDSTLSSTDYYYSQTFSNSTDNMLQFNAIQLGGNMVTDSTVTNVCYPDVSYLSNFTIVGGEADAPIHPINNSQTQIQGYNFGALKGKVYMTKADDSPTHSYIPLDNYDVIDWNDSTVTINVPSDLLPSNPYFGSVPATGKFCVKPYLSPDSSITSFNLWVSYSVINAIGTNFKARLAFSYLNVIDSTGRRDSSAYWFKFDIATVAHNADSFCRPLLKTAIQDWACELSIRYRIGTDTTIVNGYNKIDGISYVSFNNNMSNVNYVAQTRAYPQYCTPTYYSPEADISFLSTLSNWYFVRPDSANLGTNTQANTYDFFSIALHELGHASLLKHVNDVADLMYYTTFAGHPRGSISSNDLDGGIDNVTYSKTKTFPNAANCAYAPITIPANGSSFCTSPTSGIKEQIGNNTFQLSVYPNPTSQLLNVTFIKDKESSNTVKLINLMGQTVYYRNIGKNEGANEVINIGDLAKGVYMLIVTDDANTVYKKVIVD